MIEYIVSLASGDMYKFNSHKLYTEQTVSQIVLGTNYIRYKLYQEQMLFTTMKNSVKKDNQHCLSLLAAYQQLQ